MSILNRIAGALGFVRRDEVCAECAHRYESVIVYDGFCWIVLKGDRRPNDGDCWGETEPLIDFIMRPAPAETPFMSRVAKR